MADKKISELTGATTPLAGTEVVPLVQSSTTKKVSVADLTAGRTISVLGLTVSSNNIVISTAGKGIDFSANSNAAGMTSELLTWYEEGTWSPRYNTLTPPTTPFTMTIKSATYTRIGRQVTVRAYFGTNSVDLTGASGALIVTNLPFTSAASDAGYSSVSVGYAGEWNAVYPLQGFVNTGSTALYLRTRTNGSSADFNIEATNLTAGNAADKNMLVITATYFV